VATVVALVLLLQFKTHSTGSSTGAIASLGSIPIKQPRALHRRPRPAGPSPLTSTTPPAHRHHASTPTAAASPTATSTPSRTARPSVTTTGQTINTQYGPVQVRITETAGRLTNVAAIQLPSGDSRSSEIAAHAAPILRSEALRANSAHIDVVSGATYTSDGYAQSLQSALDVA
jgi:uncharacterized protein with FMN-binding domain